MSAPVCARCGSDAAPLRRSKRSGGTKQVCLNVPACRRRSKRLDLRRRRQR